MQTYPNVQAQAWREGSIELAEILGLTAGDRAALAAEAQICIDAGDSTGSLTLLDLLQQLDRSDRHTALIRAQLLLELGRSRAAETIVGEVLHQDQTNSDAWILKARLDAAAGDLNGATSALTQALQHCTRGSPAQRRAAASAARILEAIGHQ